MTFGLKVEIGLSNIGKASQLRISFGKEFQTSTIVAETLL